MEIEKPLFVTVKEIQKDWGISKSMAYNIVNRLSKQLLEDNPRALVFPGKINRAFYEECCGIKKAQ